MGYVSSHGSCCVCHVCVCGVVGGKSTKRLILGVLEAVGWTGEGRAFSSGFEVDEKESETGSWVGRRTSLMNISMFRSMFVGEREQEFEGVWKGGSRGSKESAKHRARRAPPCRCALPEPRPPKPARWSTRDIADRRFGLERESTTVNGREEGACATLPGP